MIFWRQSGADTTEFSRWLLEHRKEILDGGAEYEGVRVTGATVLTQYVYVISLGVITVTFNTEHFLPAASNNYLRHAAIKYALISFIAGWWCFPWGPPFTLYAIYNCATGGRDRTVASLLQLLQWGWDAPRDATAASISHDPLDVSESALQEIGRRMREGDFPDELGVRLTPVKQSAAEIPGQVEIAFDYPVSDGQEWIDDTCGIVLLFDKRYEDQLAGKKLDFDGAVFSVREKVLRS